MIVSQARTGGTRRLRPVIPSLCPTGNGQARDGYREHASDERNDAPTGRRPTVDDTSPSPAATAVRAAGAPRTAGLALPNQRPRPERSMLPIGLSADGLPSQNGRFLPAALPPGRID